MFDIINMIVKSLLFIIICLFVYETISSFIKQQQDYFTNKDDKEIFEDIPPEYLDIDHSIKENCKKWSENYNKIILQSYKPESNESLDTPYYSRFKPLLYNKDRKYYWNPHYLIEEGQRRFTDDKKDLDQLKLKYDTETDPNNKKILEDELALYDWQNYIYKPKNLKDEKRNMPDIITDYDPNEIGQVRSWLERHSHIPDYKRLQIDSIYKSDVQKYNTTENRKINLTV